MGFEPIEAEWRLVSVHASTSKPPRLGYYVSYTYRIPTEKCWTAILCHALLVLLVIGGYQSNKHPVSKYLLLQCFSNLGYRECYYPWADVWILIVYQSEKKTSVPGNQAWKVTTSSNTQVWKETTSLYCRLSVTHNINKLVFLFYKRSCDQFWGLAKWQDWTGLNAFKHGSGLALCK